MGEELTTDGSMAMTGVDACVGSKRLDEGGVQPDTVGRRQEGVVGRLTIRSLYTALQVESAFEDTYRRHKEKRIRSGPPREQSDQRSGRGQWSGADEVLLDNAEWLERPKDDIVVAMLFLVEVVDFGAQLP